MAERLADIAVGALVLAGPVVGGVLRRVGHLRLRGAVFGVVHVEAVADVAEEPRRELLLHRPLSQTAQSRRKGREW